MSSASALRLSAHTNFANKLPKYPSTGNVLKDGERQAAHEQLMTIISECQNDYRHIGPLTNLLMQRLRSDAKGITPNALAKFSTVAVTDPAFLVDWVVHASDLTADDLKHAVAKEPSVLSEIVGFATQHPIKQKHPEMMGDRDLHWRVLDKMHERAGSRLKVLKSGGYFKSDQSVLDLTEACYAFEFQGDVLKMVTHLRTKTKVEVPDWMRIRSGANLVNAYSEKHAAFELQGSPPVPLSSFFGKDKGPNSGEDIHEHKKFKAFVGSIFADLSKERSPSKQGDQHGSDVVTHVQRVRKANMKGSIQEAREKAKAKMAERKAKSSKQVVAK